MGNEMLNAMVRRDPQTAASVPAGLQPLNRDRDFSAWPHFDPGIFLDHNASFVRLADQGAWSVFCRDMVPPLPGRASLWAVQVDDEMKPIGQPKALLGAAADPRVIVLGDRVLVFYVVHERNAEDAIDGASMALAEFTVSGGTWSWTAGYKLPKNPMAIDLPEGCHPNWEKNWVPFVIDSERVGLIYTHEPWAVLILLAPPGTPPRFENAHRASGIDWNYGPIRGGTPPVRFDAEHLVTFFHSVEVIGSRRVYSAGACVFLDRAPFSPVSMTTSPLLLAPYHSGVHRFGWNFAISAIFPLGAERTAAGYRLLCGRDDGEVVSFDVHDDELAPRLSAVTPRIKGVLHDYRGGQGVRVPLQSLLYVPDPIPGIPELPMINFLKIIAGRGRTFVDIGAHIGFYSMGLAPGYARVLSFEPSRFQYGWLRRNAAFNDYTHVSCEHSALGDSRGTMTLNVLSYDGGLNTLSAEIAATHATQYAIIDQYEVPVGLLDDRALTDVDLIKIDVEGFELAVLRGAVETINASRPVILMEVWNEPERRREIEEMMAGLEYSVEYLFPRSPELGLCLPREKRADFAWFV